MTDFGRHSIRTTLPKRLVLSFGGSFDFCTYLATNSDIEPKFPGIFQEGKGRKHEADFVVFSGPPHNKDTSLIVVEAKAPSESLKDARCQAELYAFNLRTPLSASPMVFSSR